MSSQTQRLVQGEHTVPEDQLEATVSSKGAPVSGMQTLRRMSPQATVSSCGARTCLDRRLGQAVLSEGKGRGDEVMAMASGLLDPAEPEIHTLLGSPELVAGSAPLCVHPRAGRGHWQPALDLA